MELIKTRDVDTQEELLMLLRAAGFECTQATVSRDIRELKIVKASNGKGGYRYVSATLPTSEHIATKFAKILADTVKSVDQAMNLVSKYGYDLVIVSEDGSETVKELTSKTTDGYLRLPE